MNESINTMQYWEDRFCSNLWKENLGEEQTRYFATLLKENIPPWLVEKINSEQLSVVDLGCAEGDALPVLADIFMGRLHGIDFSQSAITKAQNTYGNYTYSVGDITNLTGQYGVAYISNVLEHFEDPVKVLSAVTHCIEKYIIILIPFEEEHELQEHVCHFDFDKIPLAINQFTLAHYSLLYCDYENSLFDDKQLLLVYTKDQELLQQITIEKSADVIRQLRALEPNILRETLAQARTALNNELLVSKNAYIKINDLQNKIESLEYTNKSVQNELGEAHGQIANMQGELSGAQNQIANMQGELSGAQNQIANMQGELSEAQNQIAQNHKEVALQIDNVLAEQKEHETTKETLREWEAKYENLYHYSCNQDAKLTAITASRSYQFFVKYLKPGMHVSYKVAQKLKRTMKALATLNLKAFAGEITSPFVKIGMHIKGRLESCRLRTQIAKDVSGKQVIILPPTLDWSMPLFQRPQQLALAYARKANTIVIYMTKNIQYDHVGFAQKVGDAVWIVNELYLDALCTPLCAAKQTVLSLSWTPNKFYCDKLNPDKLIYEYIDELEIFHMYGPEMEEIHQELMGKADVTVCTATKLYNQALGKAKNPIVSTNAGDYDFFSKTKDYETSPWIKEIIKPYKCVLGYYGAVAKWFDYDLVKDVARMHPEWVWIIVGIDYDKTLGKSGFEQFENIVYVPPQPYKDLPSFLTAFDVATIPFLINDITLSTSPVKLFEYMAAGKPVVTSKMPECLKYDSVMRYENAKEFCDYVDKILCLGEHDRYWGQLEQDAKNNTWDAKTDEILKSIE